MLLRRYLESSIAGWKGLYCRRGATIRLASNLKPRGQSAKIEDAGRGENDSGKSGLPGFRPKR